MAFEWFNANTQTLYKLYGWKIKPHTNRTEWRDYLGNNCVPECKKCGCRIEYGHKAFHCLTDPIRIRGSERWGRKVCLKCGIEILKSVTSGETISDFDKMLLELGGIVYELFKQSQKEVYEDKEVIALIEKLKSLHIEIEVLKKEIEQMSADKKKVDLVKS